MAYLIVHLVSSIQSILINYVVNMQVCDFRRSVSCFPSHAGADTSLHDPESDLASAANASG